MDKVKAFFAQISEEVITRVSADRGKLGTRQKGRSSDLVTAIDTAIEELLVQRISMLFPGDEILAEEGYTESQIGMGRTWIIDPICGTNNLARGMDNFCTNIALSEGGVLVASCVIDHSRGDYIWSIGGGKVFVNSEPLQTAEDMVGTLIDVDLGSIYSAVGDSRRHCDMLEWLETNTDYMLVSLNTSLSYAYTAMGVMSGFITVFSNPWDICAAGFLVQQAGGHISDINGSSWNPMSIGGQVAALDKKVHDTLLMAWQQVGRD